MEKVVAIFDIGKTNKKVLLINKSLKVVYETEEKFSTTVDEDGVECDDIERIESWMFSFLENLVCNKHYELAGVNFSTYGATLVWLDGEGKRLTPVYNYLKPIDAQFQQALFDQNGGEVEFCRNTASPALGMMLNSGVQISWMQSERPDVFSKARHILHFPQYLSSLLTRKYVSELTSIGCHTFMWDFDHQEYHPWLREAGVSLPDPVKNNTLYKVTVGDSEVKCGVGIHDSSASLVPYLMAESEPFLLISTGTWCINMNPFNHEPLTAEELKQDSLCYISVNQNSVKSSRFFLGHIHDVNVERLTKWFDVSPQAYKDIVVDRELVGQMVDGTCPLPGFFASGVPEAYVDEAIDLSAFADFNTAYHQLMFDLSRLTAQSIRLVISDQRQVHKMFVSGGFARNEIFVRLMGDFFPSYEVLTSRVDNSSALGAALVIMNGVLKYAQPEIDLDLKRWKSFKELV
ncbi:FGGY-family carbohydrate kinase [Geofilum rubicundum]|uniref:Rhamnulokinase RhaK in alpha-proteobacteria n=1 Tax=Geofilum rubicundum JCM 15548 TaxID=1236989 RepID=A0A0E9LX55_9BACT|nr:FGGY family carbohydrate kinase [Geofilum rubicundum]GAO29430.1 rhamnulokinase RhaK in alpha-proteobacteria [Geofilum rubicundum JCM 15548]